jgi:hypothetical protein
MPVDGQWVQWVWGVDVEGRKGGSSGVARCGVAWCCEVLW